MYKLWAAEPSAFEQYVKAQQKWAMLKTRAELELDEQEVPLPYEKQGNVGIISITGPLISGSAGWWGALFGVTGYDDIANAVAEGVRDKDIQALVYRVDSPGGMVQGLDSALETMRNAKDLLPSYTHSDFMASAAFWLGSATANITSSRLGMVGSVGALMQHMDFSKALDEDGIKVTTIRSDPDKANTSPYEPLSERAQEQLQELIEGTRDIFVEDLSINMGVSVRKVKNDFGAGRMFLAEEAKNRGMVHSVGKFQDTVAKASRMGKRRANKKGS